MWLRVSERRRVGFEVFCSSFWESEKVSLQGNLVNLEIFCIDFGAVADEGSGKRVVW